MTVIGTIPEVTRALRILQERGQEIGFNMNVSKCRAYWPKTLQASLTPLTQQFPLQVPKDGGLALLGAPIGTDEFIQSYFDAKLTSCSNSLRLLDPIPDSRIRFHLHRMTDSVCKVLHVFRLTPPSISMATALMSYRMTHILASTTFVCPHPCVRKLASHFVLEATDSHCCRPTFMLLMLQA